MAPRARIVNWSGGAGSGTAREGKIFANRLADDFCARIEQSRDDGRIEFGYESLQDRRSVGQRNTCDGVGVFDRHLLTRETAARRALDVGLHHPGAVFVLVAFGPV